MCKTLIWEFQKKKNHDISGELIPYLAVQKNQLLKIFFIGRCIMHFANCLSQQQPYLCLLSFSASSTKSASSESPLDSFSFFFFSAFLKVPSLLYLSLELSSQPMLLVSLLSLSSADEQCLTFQAPALAQDKLLDFTNYLKFLQSVCLLL